jgi:Ca2+-transporting ATPase
MSTSALRCLGFAYKEDLSEFRTYSGDEDHPAHQLLLDLHNYSSIESNLTFVGLAGLRVSFSSNLLFSGLFSCFLNHN